MSTAYTALADARAIVLQLTSVETTLNLIVDLKLQASAGTATKATTLGTTTIDPGAIIYRFYYVAAKMVEQSLDVQSLESADGARFTGLIRPIQSWLMEQYATDQALGLSIPAGFDCVSALQSIVGLDKTLALIGTQSVDAGVREYPEQWLNSPPSNRDLILTLGYVPNQRHFDF